MKKVLGLFSSSFLKNLVGGAHSFFNFFKGGLLKKSLGNFDLELVGRLNGCVCILVTFVSRYIIHKTMLRFEENSHFTYNDLRLLELNNRSLVY